MRIAPDMDLERRVERRLLPARASAPSTPSTTPSPPPWSVTASRCSACAATVFIWFGVLKIIGRSPVEDLVADMVYWLPADRSYASSASGRSSSASGC